MRELLADETARIFTIPKLGEKLKQDSTPLTYTPRKFISNPYTPIFYVIESDHRVSSNAAVERMVSEKVCLLLASSVLAHLFSQEASGSRVDRSILQLPPAEFGRPRAAAGSWASLIRVMDPLTVSISSLQIGPKADFA